MDIVTVTLNLSSTLKKLGMKAVKAQLALSQTAFEDCNKYCKVDTGKLQNSGKVDKVTGIMTWTAPYARNAYYTGAPNKTKNPLASLMWAHKAAEVNREKWRGIVADSLK